MTKIECKATTLTAAERCLTASRRPVWTVVASSGGYSACESSRASAFVLVYIDGGKTLRQISYPYFWLARLPLR